MSTPARIDELRKKFDENPRRYFAPLANEYRKAGDLPQAIALCREHLPKQPGHMSGHIVYGQALYEAGELGEARTVFESALALDPENLIALRHLGDIAKAGGDASAARRWYERVLDADPRNDDIAAQLATLGSGTGTPSAPMPSVPPPFSPPASTPAPDAAYGPLSPTPAFGMGALPTPDAAMRAVDFDVVNAEIARYTPLGIDAIESSVGAERTPHEPEASTEERPQPQPEARPTFEPLDLDAMEAIGEPQSIVEAPEHLVETTPEPEHVHAEIAAAETEVGPDETGTPAPDGAPERAPGEHAHTVDEVQASDDALDDAFASSARHVDEQEHDDVDFEEGIFAPEWPADTADIIASIATPRTVTPLFVNVTPDDAVAFGREAHEVPAHQADDELDVPSAPLLRSEAHVQRELVAPAIDAASDVAEEDGPAHDVTADHVVDDGAGDEGVSAADSVLETIPEEEAHEVAHEEARKEAHEASFADIAVGDFDAEAIGDDAPDATNEVAADADGTVVAHEPTTDTSPHAGDHEPAPAHAPEPMQGFATETMGELLVAQGFIARAADVYEELVRRRPYDPVLTSRLAELRERLASEAAPATAESEQATRSRNTPLHNTPLHNTPLHNTPLHNTPLRNTPLRNTPLRNTPLRATPVRATPFAAVPAIDPFAQGADDTSSLTSRELFARIAARRVPRRTPPHASPAVTHDSADGLASLFGGTEPSHDDAAAQALADAFAPISAQEMASGTGLDLDFGSADASTPSPVSTGAVSFGAGRPAASAMQSSAPSTPASNAGFSFDRFFPDPARPQEGRAASAPADPATPGGSNAAAPAGGDQPSAPGKTTEDLAQFSAWLKGLGGS